MKRWENKVEVRPVPNQNFNMDFMPCAMTRGAPVLPRKVHLPTTKDMYEFRGFFVDEVVNFIKEVHAENGIVFQTSAILTHPRILHQLSEGNSVTVFDKFSPTIALANQYNSILCTVPRSQFPGNRIPHLVRRDGQDDRGIMDASRMAGLHFGRSAPFRENETRPLMHRKSMVGLFPAGKKFEVRCALKMTANSTGNAENSWEEFTRIDDAPYARTIYDAIAHTYSFSEGLFAFAPGPMPTYEWRKHPPKTKKVPGCPECKSNAIGLTWWAKKGEPLSRRLCCADCGEVFGKPFLLVNQPVK